MDANAPGSPKRSLLRPWPLQRIFFGGAEVGHREILEQTSLVQIWLMPGYRNTRGVTSAHRTSSMGSNSQQTIFITCLLLLMNDKYRHAMIRRRCILPLTVVIAGLVGSSAQSPLPPKPAIDVASQEAAVIESMATKIAFENDGNFTREQNSRIRVQTDAGVKAWGMLSFPFQAATQTVDIDYVRVHKADGSTIVTPPDNIQDLDSEITRSAPFYSDLREKHVAVKGLGKGDILEYEAHWHTTKPLIPGQFWFEYNFHHEGVVLNERVEIRVPETRAVKVKGPQPTQTVTTESGSHIYAWTYSKLQSTKEPE